MPRATQTKLYRTFVKGLISEAGYLTYPDDSSYAESNTILSRKGNRTRRLGVDYEDNYTLSLLTTEANNEALNEFVWNAVDNKPYQNFLVQQTGTRVRFFDLATSPVSTHRRAFDIELSLYTAPGYTITDIFPYPCQFASGKGFLFICHPYVEPLIVQYNTVTSEFTVNTIVVQVRDFEGLPDGLANDEEPLELTKEHHYNLQNQGWVGAASNSNKTAQTQTLNGYSYNTKVKGYTERTVEDYASGNEYQYDPVDSSVDSYQTDLANSPIFVFQQKIGRYPGNNKQWWVARQAADDDTKGVKAGDFLPEILNTLFSGNNRAPRGHYVLNAFKKDRSAVSGISDIPIEEIGSRPSTVSFFSGRAWYACNSNIYYSQILDSSKKAGLCYQEADPTAEDISDLIASDGGQIPIPEANSIQRLVPLANGMMVFAMNGVWFISGGRAGFSAVDISVDKVSSIGTRNPLAIVNVDDSVYWWSEIGIQALQQASGQFGPIPGKFGNTNISEQTIQTLYNNIPDNVKVYSKGIYDPKNNLIQWLYKTDSDGLNYTYNNILLFDVTLQAFYTWEISQLANGPKIAGVFLEQGILNQQTQDTVVSNGQTVISQSQNVVTSVFTQTAKPTNLTYTTVIGNYVTFSKFNNQFYVDWSSFDGDGTIYESYVETGFEIMNDAMRRKQAKYISCHFRRTEDDPLSPPSTCQFQVKWDWASSGSTNKWTTPIEAYRPKVFIKETTADVDGFPVVISKNKVRGSGKAVQFRFGTSERGKNFDLLGWSVAYVGNTEP